MTTELMDPPTEINHSHGEVRTAEEFRSLTEELAQKISMVRIRVFRWRGKSKLNSATVRHEGLDLTPGEDVTAPSLYLLPPEWEKRFQSVETMLRRVVSRYAIKMRVYNEVELGNGTVQRESMILDDADVVPREAVANIRQQYDAIVKSYWKPLVEEFCNNYDAMLSSIRTTMPAAKFALVEPKLPKNSAAIRSSFAVFFFERPLGVNADDLAMSTLEKSSGDYLLALRESIIRESVGKLQEATSRLLDIVSNKGVVKTATVAAVTEAIQLFRGFSSAVDDEKIEVHLQCAEDVLTAMSLKTLNEDNRNGARHVATQLMETLQGITKATQDAITRAEFGPLGAGKGFRGVRLQ